MKRLAIISVASFYLLLTTGMFVCIVSCSGKWLTSVVRHSIEDSADNLAKTHPTHSSKKKHCDGDKDCSCCKKHGNYVVKENLKPSVGFEVSTLPLIAVQNKYTLFSQVNHTTAIYKWHQNNAPPPGSLGPDIHIRICSFLI
jgi:hypothetical protein